MKKSFPSIIQGQKWKRFINRKERKVKIKIDQSLKTEEFAYFLPPELIAQDPIQQRDSSRLLVLAKDSGKIKDSTLKSCRDF